MQEEIVIDGYQLTASTAPPGLTVTPSPLKGTNIPALRSTANSQAILIKQLPVPCTCNGPVPGGTFSGTGTGTIVASTPRVTCEGQQILSVGDAVTFSVSGTIATGGGATSPGTVSVTVTITKTPQLTVTANKA
jgi:hypothetical protein